MDRINKDSTFSRVVVTRPKAQCGTWIERIVESKHEAVVVSALDIIPVTGEPQQRAIKNCVMQLDAYALVIFVSQNAVHYAFEWIENYWPQLPEKLIWMAIGAKTHAVMNHYLAQIGLKATGIDSEHMTSEALLDTPQLNQVSQQKVLIFRGVGGRNTLSETLRERGATVDHCELYERKMPANALTNLNKHALSPARDILTFFSGETLTNFYQLLRQSDIKNWQEFSVLVPSERVFHLAKDCGFHRVILAKNAGESAMWDALHPFLSDT